MMKALADKAVEYLTWYLSLDDNRFMISTREFNTTGLYSMPRVKAMKKYLTPSSPKSTSEGGRTV